MEIKIKIDASFFWGLFSGIILSLILIAASVGFTVGISRVGGPSGNPQAPEAYYPAAPAPPAPQAPAPAAYAPPPPQAPPPTRANVTFDDLDGRPSNGPANAKITLVEFSDFHCPFCKRVGPSLVDLQKNFPGQVRRVWRHFPLAMHVGAQQTHEASECAFEQGKFWEYHDKLFETLGQPRDPAALVKIAEDLKLNKSKFEKCLTTEKYKDRVLKDIAKGSQSGVSGTPAVFVNGQIVEGSQPYQTFEQIVKSKL
ncbi:MAG TPA: DsbA family protein [bacterium]|nr:DsbA family protein [bacterium]